MKNIFTYSTAALLGLALVATPDADAQQFSKRKQYNSVGFSINAMDYFGDVVPKPNFTSFRLGATRLSAGVSVTRRFYPRLSGRFGLTYGRITGSDAQSTAGQSDPDAAFRRARNMTFRNDIFEASAVAIVDLVENRNNYLKRPDFVPYVFGGVAGFYHDPKGLYSDNTYVDLQPLKTEGQATAYSKFQVSIPFGGGIRYRINRNFDASLEVGWRYTFTDYLDDVSTRYADPKLLTTAYQQYFGGSAGVSGPSISAPGPGTEGFNTGPKDGNPGNIRGISTRNDWYIVTGVTLNYILTPRIKNPKFR